MHEFDVVKSLFDSLLPELEKKGVKRVAEVKFRIGSTFSKEALLHAFDALSKGTILEGAAVKVDVLEKKILCQCGREQFVTSEDLLGHIFVCPNCGETHEIDEVHDLELLEVVAEV